MKLINKVLSPLHSIGLPKIFLATTAEGMLSFSNFIIGIIMARYASKADYGLYVILFSFIGIIGAYQNAIINAPLMVLLRDKRDMEKRDYISSLAIGKNYIFIPLLILILLGAILNSVRIHSFGEYIGEVMVLCIVTMIYLSKEFLRTLKYVALDIKGIFLMDLQNLIAIIIGTILLLSLNIVSSIAVLMVLGIGYLSAYIYARRKESSFLPGSSESIKKALKENWRYAKWMVMGATCTLLQLRGYIFIVSVILGLDALADLSAARLLLMPISLLNLSSSKIVIAKGSGFLADSRNREFRKLIFYCVCILVSLVIIYILVLSCASEAIVEMLGEKYRSSIGLILYWGVFFILNTVRTQVGTALLVYREVKELAFYDFYASVFTIITCLTLAFMVKEKGAVVALILGELLMTGMYLRLYRHFKIFIMGKGMENA